MPIESPHEIETHMEGDSAGAGFPVHSSYRGTNGIAECR